MLNLSSNAMFCKQDLDFCSFCTVLATLHKENKRVNFHESPLSLKKRVLCGRVYLNRAKATKLPLYNSFERKRRDLLDYSSGGYDEENP